MNELITWSQENTLFAVLAALLLLFVVTFIVRAMFKLALLFVVIGVVMIMFFGYTPDEVVNIGQQAVGTTNAMVEKTIRPIIEKELDGAQYKTNPDKTFEMQTKSVKITGKSGENKVIVHYQGKQFNVDISTLGAVIEKQIQSIEQEAEQRTTK